MVELEKNDAFISSLMVFLNSTKICLLKSHLVNFVMTECVGRP